MSPSAQLSLALKLWSLADRQGKEKHMGAGILMLLSTCSVALEKPRPSLSLTLLYLCKRVSGRARMRREVPYKGTFYSVSSLQGRAGIQSPLSPRISLLVFSPGPYPHSLGAPWPSGHRAPQPTWATNKSPTPKRLSAFRERIGFSWNRKETC